MFLKIIPVRNLVIAVSFSFLPISFSSFKFPFPIFLLVLSVFISFIKLALYSRILCLLFLVLEKALRETLDVISFSFVIPVLIPVGYLFFIDDISPSGQNLFPDTYIGIFLYLGDLFFFKPILPDFDPSPSLLKNNFFPQDVLL